MIGCLVVYSIGMNRFYRQYLKNLRRILHKFNEFKYNPRSKTPQPAVFLKQYPDAEYKVINNENFMYDFW